MRVFLFVFLLFLSLPAEFTHGTGLAKSYGISRHNDLKYPPGFMHFEYANPKAPKGGTMRIGVVGTFDSTNPYLTKGTAPVGLSRFSEALVFDSLMKKAADEPFSLYGWVAEFAEIAPDHSWILFHLNPAAEWDDGTPIMPEDVIFTHTVFRDHGAPNLRRIHGKVARVEQVGSLGVKFTFKQQADGSYNSELPYIMAQSSVLPKAYFQGKDFEKTALDFIPGSGPYKIVSVKPGHRIVYERRKGYWAKDLNVMKGMGNFDQVIVDYYRDMNVARMAFMAGEFDCLAEGHPSHQKILREQAAKSQANISLIEFKHYMSVPFSTFCMNTRKPMFSDKRVRRALALAFDFQRINTNLFHGLKKRNRSFFENTELAHQGPLTDAERVLLNPLKDDIPKEVFTQPYDPPNNRHDQQSIRSHLKMAAALLKEAGYKVERGQLVHAQTGKPFAFELMLYSKETEKIALAFARSLKQLGITMSIRTLDAAQYEMRRLKFDFDMIVQAWFAGQSPGNELLFYWGSDLADQEGSRNYPGIKNKAIDHLCQVIADAKTREELKTACHALDRVLMWGEYVIPLFYSNDIFVAYNRDFGYPNINPKVPILLATWWKKMGK